MCFGETSYPCTLAKVHATRLINGCHRTYSELMFKFEIWMQCRILCQLFIEQTMKMCAWEINTEAFFIYIYIFNVDYSTGFTGNIVNTCFVVVVVLFFSSRWLRTFDTLHFKLFNLLNIHVFPLMLPFVYVQWIFACYILTIIKENHNERMFVSFYNLKSKSKTTTKTTKNKNKAKTQVCVSCFISIKICFVDITCQTFACEDS